MNSLFAIDTRSLALFRIGLAVTILGDLASKLPMLKVLYSDAGVLPREALFKNVHFTRQWSLAYISGSYFFELALWVVAAVAAAALLVGFRTRLASAVCWILTVSWINRSPLFTTGADSLLRVLLFWSLFLPLGARGSLDQRKMSPSGTGVFSAASMAVLVQVTLVYLFTWLHKSSSTWWPDNTAVYYALSLDYMTTPFGAWMGQLPLSVLSLFNALTFWFELAAPLLLFSTAFTPRLRLAVIAALVFMHFVFYLSFRLGFFPWINIVALGVFIPSWFWDRIFGNEALPATQKPPGIKSHILENTVPFICLVLVLIHNIDGLKHSPLSTPAWFARFMHTLALHQKWSMFAASPPLSHGWYIAAGTLEDGGKADLLRDGSPLEFESPRPLSGHYGDYRWRKFFENIRKRQFGFYRKSLAGHLCREWNGRPAAKSKVKSIDIYFMEQKTRLDRVREKPTKKVYLKNFAC